MERGHRLDFVIGGAQKSGTTTLDAILRRHPELQMAKVKETHFFDDESRDWSRPDYAALDAFFDPPDGRLRGEATPATLYWHTAIPRLAAYNPDVNIVLILRNPITRAFAQWRKTYADGNDTMAFADAIRAWPGRVRGAAEARGLHRTWSYVERGFYGAQLAYLREHFQPRQIHVEIHEEFFANRADGLERLSKFLDIAPFPAAIPAIHRFPAKPLDYPSRLTQYDIDHLETLYRDDIAMLEALLGRPIPSWRQTVTEDA